MGRTYWTAVHAERRALAEQLRQIRDDDAWQTPSLCPGWTVHDVLAHLVDDATTTPVRFAADLVRARFDFDAVNRRGVQRAKGPSAAATMRRFAEVADSSTGAPAPAATRLVEVIVHGEDIRRPLALGHDYPVAATLVALTHQLKTSTTMGGGRQRARGLTLRADDPGFTHGEGPEVTGPALALLLAVSGRAVATGELAGPGATRLIAAGRP
jgi:uncharacterized protein (TIGR03083 family)